MDSLRQFGQISVYLSHPLILIGFVLFLFFGVHRLLIKSGIIQPLHKHEGSKVIRLLLRYGFIIALVTILIGFFIKGWQIYVSKNGRKQITNAALAQVKKELVNNFLNLSISIGGVEYRKPTAFWEKRRLNETELAYQDRAKNYFQQYQLDIRLLLDENEANVLSGLFVSGNINIKLRPGNEGYKAALQESAKFWGDKVRILKERVGDTKAAEKREIERRIRDPYLLMLRKWAGLSDTLSQSAIFALQKKEIDTVETDPAELVSLAALSFLESDGFATITYFERALRADSLKPFQKLFIELSLDRLKNPEKYENSIGLLILRIDPGGSFDKAGLKVGDVLLSMDGKVLIEPMDIASEIGVGGKKPYLLRVIRDDQSTKVVLYGGESAQATLTQLVFFKPIQL